jgi:hypothetical protein
MSIYDATLAMIDALETLGIDYLLVGSLAASYYGLSRSTTDADFVLQLKQHRLKEIVERMGGGYRLEPQTAFEVFTNKRVDVIHVVGTIFKIDVFPLSDDSFDQTRFQRRIKGQIAGRVVSLPTAEDVIIMKVRWHRALDLEDAKYVLSIQSPSLDWPYIERWCEAHGTRQVLEDLRREIPPIQ